MERWRRRRKLDDGNEADSREEGGGGRRGREKRGMRDKIRTERSSAGRDDEIAS